MSTATAPTTSRRLYRSTRDSRLGGVCGGIAEVMGWDVTTVRLVAALSLLLPGPQAIIYLVAWAIVPTDATVFGWNNQPAAPTPPMPTPPANMYTAPAPAPAAEAPVAEPPVAHDPAAEDPSAEAPVTDDMGDTEDPTV